MDREMYYEFSRGGKYDFSQLIEVEKITQGMVNPVEIVFFIGKKDVQFEQMIWGLIFF